MIYLLKMLMFNSYVKYSNQRVNICGWTHGKIYEKKKWPNRQIQVTSRPSKLIGSSSCPSARHSRANWHHFWRRNCVSSRFRKVHQRSQISWAEPRMDRDTRNTLRKKKRVGIVPDLSDPQPVCRIIPLYLKMCWLVMFRQPFAHAPFINDWASHSFDLVCKHTKTPYVWCGNSTSHNYYNHNRCRLLGTILYIVTIVILE